MALESLNHVPASVDGQPNAVPVPNGAPSIIDGVKTSADGVDDGNRPPPRLPRWTRHEILVLIQGKKVAENRVRRGRTGGSAFGSSHLEPKWASVSSYCKRHGVNRGPVQCRKRWSNLAGDYKKIKEWESQITGDADSFWVMRNDLRRERKLPGFFDREVYDILDGAPPETADEKISVRRAVEEVEAEAPAAAEAEEVLFDSGRTAAADDGLFSDSEQSPKEDAGGSPEKEAAMESPITSVPAPAQAPLLISEKQYQPFYQDYVDQGTANEKQPTINPEKGSTSQEGQKRIRLSSAGSGDSNLQDQLIEVLERNSRTLTAQLEAQNMNCQLDRDQRKDHAENLVGVLSKLADALGRIADKL